MRIAYWPRPADCVTSSSASLPHDVSNDLQQALRQSSCIKIDIKKVRFEYVNVTHLYNENVGSVYLRNADTHPPGYTVYTSETPIPIHQATQCIPPKRRYPSTKLHSGIYQITMNQYRREELTPGKRPVTVSCEQDMNLGPHKRRAI
jgi:hypothetical protein